MTRLPWLCCRPVENKHCCLTGSKAPLMFFRRSTQPVVSARAGTCQSHIQFGVRIRLYLVESKGYIFKRLYFVCLFVSLVLSSCPDCPFAWQRKPAFCSCQHLCASEGEGGTDVLTCRGLVGLLVMVWPAACLGCCYRCCPNLAVAWGKGAS